MRSEASISISDITAYYHYIHENDYIFPGHRHRHIEFNAILDGEMEIICDEKVFRLTAGKYIILPSGSFHKNNVSGSGSAEMIVLHFLTEKVNSDTDAYASTMSTSQLQLLKLLCEDFEVRQHISNCACSSVADTALKLFEVFLYYGTAKPDPLDKFVNEKVKIYQTAVKYMQNNLNRTLSLPEISKECNTSCSTLKNVFSQYTGLGCIAFFTQLRLEHAKRLLSSGMRCCEVSNTLGFSSQAYFSKCFKDFFGFLPSDILKSR